MIYRKEIESLRQDVSGIKNNILCTTLIKTTTKHFICDIHVFTTAIYTTFLTNTEVKNYE